VASGSGGHNDIPAAFAEFRWLDAVTEPGTDGHIGTTAYPDVDPDADENANDDTDEHGDANTHGHGDDSSAHRSTVPGRSQ
jgi:hypothetical protein